MHLVLGLGNPGNRYRSTRHNVGFLVADRLASRAGSRIERKQFGALVGKAQVAGQAAMLAKPQSFMNVSGQPAVSLRGYYKLANDHVVVVHDDLDIDFGLVRVKRGGGHGGHNGLRDISARMGQDYTRVRVGISRPPAGWNTADYVLGRWTDAQAGGLDQVVDLAADAVESVVVDGVSLAMNRFNARNKRSQDLPGSNPQTPSVGSSDR